VNELCEYQNARCNDKNYQLTILATCFGCKQPSSGQRETYSRYNESVHSVFGNDLLG